MVPEDVAHPAVVGEDVGFEPLDPLPHGDLLDLLEEEGADPHVLVLVDDGDKVATCKLVRRGDYMTDEKAKQAYMTEEGLTKIEELMTRSGLLAQGESLYDAGNIRLLHHLNAVFGYKPLVIIEKRWMKF